MVKNGFTNMMKMNNYINKDLLWTKIISNYYDGISFEELYKIIERMPIKNIPNEKDYNDIIKDLKDCKNELCLYCGNYKIKHKGACDDCRWRDI